MSYARKSEPGSDVYIYASEHGLNCCGCELGSDVTADHVSMLRHLGAHLVAGHGVPARVFVRMEREMKADERRRFARGIATTSAVVSGMHPEWQWECPVCAAAVGCGCVTPDGYPRASHKKRLALVAECDVPSCSKSHEGSNDGIAWFPIYSEDAVPYPHRRHVGPVK